MLSHTHQCIFIHIPKCGGSSIENILWPKKEDRTPDNLWMGLASPFRNKYQTGGLQHLLAKQVVQEVGEKTFGEYFKFSFVRNPWDKTVSQYEYMQKRADLRAFIGMKPDDSFSRYLSLIQTRQHVQWEPQYKFVTAENGDLSVDFLGRFECYERDVRLILDHLKIGEIDRIPHANKGRRTHYRDYYDPVSRKTVQDLYREDIERFEYQF